MLLFAVGINLIRVQMLSLLLTYISVFSYITANQFIYSTTANHKQTVHFIQNVFIMCSANKEQSIILTFPKINHKCLKKLALVYSALI